MKSSKRPQIIKVKFLDNVIKNETPFYKLYHIQIVGKEKFIMYS